MRRSLAANISPKFLLMKARELASRIVREQRRTGAFEPMPIVDSNWLHRFQRDKGISYRKPNMRYKCSRPILVRRLRAMWLNLIRVRRLAEVFLQSSLGDRIYGIDEKPLHFNESGSKACRTLEIVGAPAVRLKENHAATRERASLMTSVSSDPLEAASPANMPLEILFRAQSSRRTASLVAPADLKFSVQWAVKGSYRCENIIAYLDKWLRPWSAVRQKSGDYRILMMDIAASHVGAEVVDFAWARGYVTVYHYGCTTGIAQVNDTDCHGAFEAAYVALEQTSFVEQQLIDPGCVSRTPQDVIDDAAGAWRSLNHGQGVSGHYRNGLANNLDGSQDHLLSREAAALWKDALMPALRAEALAEVDAKIASGQLTSFTQWQTLIVHPDDPGMILDEGAEFEGVLEDGEPVYLEDGEEDVINAENDLDGQDEEEGGDSSVAIASAVIAEPGDDPAQVKDAVAALQRLEVLRKLRAEVSTASVPAALVLIDREITQLERGLRCPRGGDKVANAVLRRSLQAMATAEANQIREKRAAAFEVRRLKAEEAARKAKERAEELERKRKAEQLKEDLLKVPTEYSIATVGPDTKAGWQQRVNCLERLKLRSPELPFECEVKWAHVRDQYARVVASVHKAACGKIFLDRVNKCLQALGKHYGGPTPWNRKGEPGEASAFHSFFLEMDKAIPRASTIVVV
jgi:hypothetical protein